MRPGRKGSRFILLAAKAFLVLVAVAFAQDSGGTPGASAAAPAGGPAADGGIVYVSQDGGPCASPADSCLTFEDALTHTAASYLILVSDISLHTANFSGPVYATPNPGNASAPPLYSLTRNVTIAAAPCLGTRAIDFDYVKQRLLLEPGVRVTFERLRMVRSRPVSDASIDLFLGSEGSSIILKDCEHYRVAGLPPGEVWALTTAYPRPAQFPGHQVVTQVTPGCTPDIMRDMVYDDLGVRLGGTGAPGGPDGYDMHLVNVSRLCSITLPEDCMRKMTRDQCLVKYGAAHLIGVQLPPGVMMEQRQTWADMQLRRRDGSGATVSAGAAAAIAAAAALAAAAATAGAMAGAVAAAARRRRGLSSYGDSEAGKGGGGGPNCSRGGSGLQPPGVAAEAPPFKSGTASGPALRSSATNSNQRSTGSGQLPWSDKRHSLDSLRVRARGGSNGATTGSAAPLSGPIVIDPTASRVVVLHLMDSSQQADNATASAPAAMASSDAHATDRARALPPLPPRQRRGSAAGQQNISFVSVSSHTPLYGAGVSPRWDAARDAAAGQCALGINVRPKSSLSSDGEAGSSDGDPDLSDGDDASDDAPSSSSEEV